MCLNTLSPLHPDDVEQSDEYGYGGEEDEADYQCGGAAAVLAIGVVVGGVDSISATCGVVNLEVCGTIGGFGATQGRPSEQGKPKTTHRVARELIFCLRS